MSLQVVSKDIPQDISHEELWDAFQSPEVSAVFREEYGKRFSLCELLHNDRLDRTWNKLAEIIEWRAMLREVAKQKPEGGAQ